MVLLYILVYAKLSSVNNALALIAEPNRQKILRLVWNEEKAAGAIAEQFEVTFGAVSQHLRALHEGGLLSVRKEGRLRLYRTRKEALGPLAKALEAMWSNALDRLKSAAEAEFETNQRNNPQRKRKRK